MAETAETTFDEFKGKDCSSVTDWLKIKGLHKLWFVFKGQALVVQKVDNFIHRINHYPVDSVVCFVDTYPLDSDLSSR